MCGAKELIMIGIGCANAAVTQTVKSEMIYLCELNSERFNLFLC